jgi:glycosyltransferase involved in cell wall biosynthesis
MKRVVHITCVHNPFDGRIMYRECVGLAKSGYEVILIAPARFREKIKENVRIIGLKKSGSRFKRPFAWLGILKKVLELKPEILHFHDPELLVIMPFVRLFIGKKIKIVYDVHEYLIDSIRDKFWIPVHLRKITAFFVSYFEYFLGKCVDGQVFVIHEQIQHYLNWKTEKIVLHNYPDLNCFKPDNIKVDKLKPDSLFPKKNQDKKFTLVHIGSLYERRGIMTMLKALKILVKDGYDVHLVLGGVFESQSFRRRVEDFIAENKLEEYAKILGWVDYSKINNHLAVADAVWLAHYPSLQHSQQSISTKQLEAMLASLPVICSNIPSLTRFVDEAGCGISVMAKDPKAHAEAIKKLYNNPGEAKKMGARGRQLVLEKYNWQNEARRLNDFYEALLK